MAPSAAPAAAASAAPAVDSSVACADHFAPVNPSTLRLSDEAARVAKLRSFVEPHVDSFNHAMTAGLDLLPSMIDAVTLRAGADGDDASGGVGVPVTARFLQLVLLRPRLGDVSSRVTMDALMPGEARRAGNTYSGDLMAEFEIFVGGEEVPVKGRRVGRIPVMVCSEKCNLYGKGPAEMVAAQEEQYELGGFFVINGAEKLLRMIIVQRANAVISVRRASNLKRGVLYTETSVSMRCMQRDLSTSTMHMHYLRTAGANVRVTVKRGEYFIPVGVLIRALLPSGVTARAIFDMIVGGQSENESLRASALAIVTDLDDWSRKFRAVKGEDAGVHVSMSQKAALAFLGGTFAVVLGLDVEVTPEEAGRILLRRYVLVHLSAGPFEVEKAEMNAMKVDTLVHMIRKLVACAADQIEIDNADAPSHQEVLLPGQLYLNFLKEKLEAHLQLLVQNVRKEVTKAGHLTVQKSPDQLMACVTKALSRTDNQRLVGGHMNYFLATGNIKTDTGLDLPQAAGYAIMAERINYIRFITHFRCIHRGAFYATMRSTKVRKLLPEAWGFICPIQTPDGAPCGLLNHLATQVRIPIGGGVQLRDFSELMIELGAIPPAGMSALHPVSLADSLPILCDGAVVGFIGAERAPAFATLLRQLKTLENVTTVPCTAEVVYVAPNKNLGCGFYPGIFVHTTGCRLMRPVRWLKKQTKRNRGSAVADSSDAGNEIGGTPELIGTLEQVFLQIRPVNPDAKDSVTPVNYKNATHEEISSSAFMSEVAGLTPFPEMNQGPRTIFQCQMAKQTMGTPCHLFDSRFDSKTYRLTTPQIPIVRNFSMQGPMGADLFPNGTNGIVAVLSYTGYDMEDALILNQGSVNRGFCHGTIYANKRLDLDATAMDRGKQFGPLTPEAAEAAGAVGVDGLPEVGARVKRGDKLYGTSTLGNTARDNSKGLHYTEHKTEENASIDQVQIINGAGYTEKSGRLQKPGVRQATIRTRMSRPPTVGDKFATRAGQKGTIAAVWPAEDMPFSESGMMPDVLFNPNGFPSRMTIGMMVEQMAGKSGALHGMFHDSTPFRFDEKCRAVDYFGEQLVKAGYNYYGNETLYSGYTGEPFNVDIFMGVIHYQRLRHMVSDKFQVRSTGKVNPLYRQPIQGRKRGGAIRFGEMERDGLIAHGASFLLRDRLGMASDMHVLHVCEKCGSLIAPTMLKGEVAAPLASQQNANDAQRVIVCRICEASDENDVVGPSVGPKAKTQRIAIPYSFKYLVTELAAMNIRTRLDLRNSDDVEGR